LLEKWLKRRAVVASAYAVVVAAGITTTASPPTNITAVATENFVKAILFMLLFFYQ
jgi:hypothetical protein